MQRILVTKVTDLMTDFQGEFVTGNAFIPQLPPSPLHPKENEIHFITADYK